MILAVIITILVVMVLNTMIIMVGASSSNGIFPHWSLLCCLHLSEPYEDGHDDDGHHKHLFNHALNHDDDDDDYGDDDDDDDDDDDAVRLFRTVQLFHAVMGTEEHITMV